MWHLSLLENIWSEVMEVSAYTARSWATCLGPCSYWPQECTRCQLHFAPLWDLFPYQVLIFFNEGGAFFYCSVSGMILVRQSESRNTERANEWHDGRNYKILPSKTATAPFLIYTYEYYADSKTGRKNATLLLCEFCAIFPALFISYISMRWITDLPLTLRRPFLLHH